MSNVTLKDIELLQLGKNNFELLFHFSNDNHHLISFKKGEIVEEIGYKLYSLGLEIEENSIFSK